MAKERQSRLGTSSELPAIANVDGSLLPVQGRKPGKKKPKDSNQLTVWVPEELNYRLDEIARFLKTRKTKFVLKLLDQGCSKYGIDEEIKSAFLRIRAKARESTDEAAA